MPIIRSGNYTMQIPSLGNIGLVQFPNNVQSIAYMVSPNITGEWGLQVTRLVSGGGQAIKFQYLADEKYLNYVNQTNNFEGSPADDGFTLNVYPESNFGTYTMFVPNTNLQVAADNRSVNSPPYPLIGMSDPPTSITIHWQGI